MTKDPKQAALDYHAQPTPGKIGIATTKPCTTQAELALAYTPGVAEPVREIARDPDAAYRYTIKGNLVAVITDGTAVLGLGNVGALAGKPVMEGKAVLFKRFADIDVFDIEVNAKTPQEFINTVVAIAPTFGGINLEDIAAPACFEIERALSEKLDIPVFHDDQHGTAVIICAGLLNALELQGKNLASARITCLGAGAAGIASLNLLEAMGANRANMLVVDRKGVIQTERTDLNDQKHAFAVKTGKRTLADAMRDADVFIGVSGPNLVTPEMIASMAPKPIVFALANPRPGNQPGSGARGARRPHHGHRPLGLPQPGQQRARLSVHLPRRARRARAAHHARDAGGRGAGAGEAGARAGTAGSPQGLQPAESRIRPGVHHPQTARSAPARARTAGGGARRHRLGRGARALSGALPALTTATSGYRQDSQD